MATLTQLWKRARGDGAVRTMHRDLSTQTGDLIRRLDAVLASFDSTSARLDSISTRLAQLEVEPPSPTRKQAPRTAIDPESWRERAQPGELKFHSKPNVRSGENWASDTERKWHFAGLGQLDFKDKLVVDVGAGSRLRTLYFTGARVAAIEPLADQFIAEVPWQDLSAADELYAVAAEQFIPELESRADLIVSLNALDHGYNFESAVANLRRYLKSDGRAFLSFDQHEEPDEMHPLVLNSDIVDAVLHENGFTVTQFSEAGRYHGGSGPLALNYWLAG